MIQENLLTVLGANLASIPFRLAARQPYQEPQKILILKPLGLDEVLLATPLLAALRAAYPQARIDWAIDDEVRQAVAGNPKVTALVSAEPVTTADATWAMVQSLVERLRREEYDTCFVPDRASLFSYIAWQAGIPQRIGLNIGGRGFAYTTPVKPPKGIRNEVEANLALVRSLGLQAGTGVEFFPTDEERVGIMEKIAEEVPWDNILPLVVLFPGIGDATDKNKPDRRWPAERYARLAENLIRKYGASVVLAGLESDRAVAEVVASQTEETVTNIAGRMSLGELGALCEIADLYVGNDAGPTHIAAAVGCPTLAIFGPSDPEVNGPVGTNGKVRIVNEHKRRLRFEWGELTTVENTMMAAEELLGHKRAGIPRQ